MTIDFRDRIFASLALAGIGDALGAQTEQWSIDEIELRHGGLVTTFGAPPADTFAGSNAGLRAEVTDDASQMYYLAHALVDAGGALDQKGWVACLLDWADTSPKATFMGPSTAAIVKALREGVDVAEVGVIGKSRRKMTTVGITNGAAMRVAPAGLIHPGDIVAACEQAFITCLPSHDTDVAISAACSVAAGAAKALTCPDLDAIIEACFEGGRIGAALAKSSARVVAGPRYLARLELALDIAVRASDDRAFLREMESTVGNSVLASESVPAAIGAFFYAKGDPRRTIELCASIGNDTDSIATMAGALAGAMHGTKGLPKDLYEEFHAVNAKEYALDSLATDLAGIAARNFEAMPPRSLSGT
jgi:ADP-ribosylglycohydrolase